MKLILEGPEYAPHVLAAKAALEKAGHNTSKMSASKMLVRAFNLGLVADHEGKFLHDYTGHKPLPNGYKPTRPVNYTKENPAPVEPSLQAKRFGRFFSEAMQSVTVAGVDGIPRTTPVQDQPDGLDNDERVTYGGDLPNPTQIVDKIFDFETRQKLKERYGDNWRELVTQELANFPTLQPNHRQGELNEGRHDIITRSYTAGNVAAIPLRRALRRAQDNGHDLDWDEEKAGLLRTVFHITAPRHLHNDLSDRLNEDIAADVAAGMLAEDYKPLISESLAGALNYVNSVEHGDSRPKFKSAMAWLDGVDHLYGPEVAGKANDTLYSAGHQAALQFVKSHAMQPREKLVSRSTVPEDNVAGRLDNGPYSQLHARHTEPEPNRGSFYECEYVVALQTPLLEKLFEGRNWFNPGGMFGRTPDETYHKGYGSYSQMSHEIMPHNSGAPLDTRLAPSSVSAIDSRLKELKDTGKIRGYKWNHDGEGRWGQAVSTVKVDADHSVHKGLEQEFDNAIRAKNTEAFAKREKFYADRKASEENPETAKYKPLMVTDMDRKVHAILSKNPEASDEEIGRAWDDHSTYFSPAEKQRLATRYRARVAYHQGKGNLYDDR